MTKNGELVKLQLIKKVVNIISIVLSVLMVISVFLPVAKATDIRRDQIDSDPNLVLLENFHYTAENSEKISLWEYAKVFLTLATEDDEISFAGEKTFGIVMLISLAFLFIALILNLFFSLLEKYIPLIVSSCLSWISFKDWVGNMKNNYYLPSDNYDVTAVKSMLLVLGACLVILAIADLVMNSIEKKKAKEGAIVSEE